MEKRYIFKYFLTYLQSNPWNNHFKLGVCSSSVFPVALTQIYTDFCTYSSSPTLPALKNNP